ncbi:MAG: aminomethyltransferase family protein [Pseudomonadota bacterium]
MAEHAVKSPLCDLITRHVDFDFDDFIARTPAEDYDHWNGYCLPVEFSDAKHEYRSIREGCGLFDASPMKIYRFKGADAGAFLDKILTSPVSSQPSLKAIYSLMCNDDGFLLDDGMMFKLSDDDYLFLITDADHDDHFSTYNHYNDLTITDDSSSYLGLALQGPKSCAVLSAFGFSELSALKPFDLQINELDGHEIVVGRVGFTGDLGYEIWFAPDALPSVEKALNAAEAATGVKGIGYGLTAIQMGRIEAGMIVPGWDTAGTFDDIAQERTPLELTLRWNVKLDRGLDFVGEQALRQQKADGPRYRMKGIRINDRAPIEEGADLFTDVDGERISIGKVPSLIWHVLDECWIGFASLQTDFAKADDVYLLVGDRAVSGELCKLPFIQLDRRTATPAPI